MYSGRSTFTAKRVRPRQGGASPATVTSVRIAPEVNSVKPAGIWVVVNTALEGTRSTELPHSELVVGPNTYSPSDVFFVDTLMGEISPGITMRGSWVFDVAPALVAPGSSDPMTLLVWVGDGRLDSRSGHSDIRSRVHASAGSTPSRWRNRRGAPHEGTAVRPVGAKRHRRRWSSQSAVGVFS